MSVVTAIGLISIAGVLSGVFSYPVTKVRNWEFEHIWSMGSLAALLLLPWPLVFLFVPDVWSVYAGIPNEVLLTVILCGVAWGIGGIFWGRAINALGLALGISLMMSLINVFGSLAPMSVFQPQLLKTPGGISLILALSVLIVGVVVISMAGREKEKQATFESMQKAGNLTSAGNKRTPFFLGLIFCIVSGVLSAGVNFGLLFGSPIAEQSLQEGSPVFAKSFVVWSLVFSANYLVNLLYGTVLMIKNHNIMKLFTEGRLSHWLWAIFMGLAWPGGIIVYGIGAEGMGPYGAYVGFPMMILLSILTGNVAGIVNGEWKGTTSRARTLMMIGIIVICSAFVLLGYSNHLLSKY